MIGKSVGHAPSALLPTAKASLSARLMLQLVRKLCSLSFRL